MKKTAAAARKNHLLPEEEKERIEAALTRMQSREVSRKTKEREGEALKKWKKEEEEKRKGGKKEFYLKKCAWSLLFFCVFELSAELIPFSLRRFNSRPKGGTPQGQVRGAVAGQEAVAQDGREEAQKDGQQGQEALAQQEVVDSAPSWAGDRRAFCWCRALWLIVVFIRCTLALLSSRIVSRAASSSFSRLAFDPRRRAVSPRLSSLLRRAQS